MAEIDRGDIVMRRFTVVKFMKKGKVRYGIANVITKTRIKGIYCIGDPEEGMYFDVSSDKAEGCEPVIIPTERLKKFARFEIDSDELAGDVYPVELLVCPEEYQATADDLAALLRKVIQIGNAEEVEKRWNVIYNNVIGRYLKYGSTERKDNFYRGYRFIPSEEERTAKIFSSFISVMRKYAPGSEWFDYNADKRNAGSFEDEISLLLKKADQVIADRSIPVYEQDYDSETRRNYVVSFDHEGMLESASEDELKLFVKFVEQGCAEEKKYAMNAKAYACYGGNRAYKCDWTVSRDLLLKLYDMESDPFIANSLGYIYYCGRCTLFEPDYASAFKWFSIGAAGGVYESRYKLADMFMHGYYVNRDRHIAENIISELYNENIKYIQQGTFDCKFADIALRLGSIEKYNNSSAAFRSCLQARFAIRMRMKETDCYGDGNVAMNINREISDILPDTEFIKARTSERYMSLAWLLYQSYEPGRHIEMKVRRLRGGDYSLRFRILPRADEQANPKLFITLPACHFCGMTEFFTVRTSSIAEFRINGKDFDGDEATVVFDDFSDDMTMTFYGREVARVFALIIAKPPVSKSEKTYTFASVTFGSDRHYEYLCDIAGVSAGDMVTVRVNGEERSAAVISVYEKNSSETALPINSYKHIIKVEKINKKQS